MSDCIVRKAGLTDLESVKSLADAHKDELGFVLRPALAESINRGEVFIAENSVGLLGFVEYHHRRDKQTTLYHIAVKLDHRMQGVGRILVTSLINDTHGLGKSFIQLKCPADLPANHFYAHLGFTLVATEDRRHRPLNVWQLRLNSESEIL
jgi:N-acetylglutamate synthase-like GNAT family acetyltransferase